jgi:hypothetical protein
MSLLSLLFFFLPYFVSFFPVVIGSHPLSGVFRWPVQSGLGTDPASLSHLVKDQSPFTFPSPVIDGLAISLSIHAAPDLRPVPVPEASRELVETLILCLLVQEYWYTYLRS